jgi:hypothetical protein
MTIKQEYLGIKIFDILTRVDIYTNWIPKERYDWFFNNGYDFLFEKEKEKEIDIKIDDIPTTE